MDRRGFFRIALASAGATASLATASMAGAASGRQPVEGPDGSLDARTTGHDGSEITAGAGSQWAAQSARGARRGD